jgi:hypothetical protein
VTFRDGVPAWLIVKEDGDETLMLAHPLLNDFMAWCHDVDRAEHFFHRAHASRRLRDLSALDRRGARIVPIVLRSLTR